MHAKDVFSQQVRAWGFSDAENLLTGLEPYIELLSSYDKANVVGTRNPTELLLNHVLDSLSCFLFRPLWQANSLVDVGSGAGLPGIPIKIASPSLSTTLVESTGKKARFLQLAVKHLGLHHTLVQDQRVEKVAFQPDQRSNNDIATVRAVSSLPVVAEYCLPLVRESGHVIAMKGAISNDELNNGGRAASQLGGRIMQVIEVSMHPEARVRDRNLVILQKIQPTPEKYPRREGTPTRRPLGSY